MERLLAIRLLKQAENNVLAADIAVTGQWDLVRDLRSRGIDTADAEARLDSLQRVQARCLLDRERLLAVFELADAGRDGPPVPREAVQHSAL
jgi:hypothetical protein